MTVNRIIFCLSTGRCGTMYLANVMDTVPNVCALHEPEPNFVYAHKWSYNKRLEWLRDKKMPYILGIAQSTYIETSNLVSQGFIEPLIELGIMFDAIVIYRDLRSVAISQWRRGHFPGRSALNQKWGLQPDFDYCYLTDYQLCYWHALEKRRRMELYKTMVPGNVYETETGKIISEPDYKNLVNVMGLPPPDQNRYNMVKNIKANKSLTSTVPPGFINEQEKRVESLFKE